MCYRLRPPDSPAEVEKNEKVQDKTRELLNSLLRGEIAAVESYWMALSVSEIANRASAISLRKIAEEHEELVETLAHQITEDGGEPPATSGRWGKCAKAVTATAHWFGNIALLNALREGEELGLKSYQQLLSEDIQQEVKSLVRQVLIPRTRSHIPLLTRILEAEIPG